jgi:hypothetical protein
MVTSIRRRVTCSPIISHFRLKNASHSSVDFFAKYLRHVSAAASGAHAHAAHPVPISTMGLFTFSRLPRTYSDDVRGTSTAARVSGRVTACDCVLTLLALS